MKVLLVDDSRTIRTMLKRTFRQAGLDGIEFFEAGNGKEGVAAVDAHKPDLILSDWNMPEMNGLEFLKEVRASGYKTPFGFVTTEEGVQHKAAARTCGADFFVEKPVTAEALGAALAPFMAKS
ncbi:MAG: response regulator [Planctomycetes bacterium]|nr:response regulator [Planctomycetota bacterium]MCB9888219.1 response regulator [Planctomycetota bacterium]